MHDMQPGVHAEGKPEEAHEDTQRREAVQVPGVQLQVQEEGRAGRTHEDTQWFVVEIYCKKLQLD